MRGKSGPTTFLSGDTIVAQIRAAFASNHFVGEGHRKAWARLTHQRGNSTSMRRVFRIMHGKRDPCVRSPDRLA